MAGSATRSALPSSFRTTCSTCGATPGKPAREDIRTAKYSLPFVLACERAPAPTRARLRRLYATEAPLDQRAVAEVVGIMERLGVREEAERLVRYHHDAARAALRAAHASPTGAAVLEQLAASLIGRES